MFEAKWVRKEKRMVQGTKSVEVFSQGKDESVWSRKENKCEVTKSIKST
jgi:hypothetical protein